jgi:YfiH family protein
MQLEHFYFFSHIPGLRHAISTRHGGVSKSTFTALNLAFHVGDDPAAVQKNRRLLSKAAEFEIKNLVAAQQVHGDQIYIVKKENAGCGALDWENAIPDTDALITAEENIPLLIQVADCAPVLLADAEARVLGTVHAGWRGAAAGIAGKTMQKMTELNADPKSTFAGIGPCLCTKCLEIGEEVADLITSHYPDAIQISTRKPHLNLREMIRQDLIETGLKPDHIEAMDECPRCDTRKYFSHRGEDGNTGRFGLIAWWEEI